MLPHLLPATLGGLGGWLVGWGLVETHLMFNVVQGIWRIHGKAYQDNMRFGVCQGAQPLIVLLSRRIP